MRLFLTFPDYSTVNTTACMITQVEECLNIVLYPNMIGVHYCGHRRFEYLVHPVIQSMKLEVMVDGSNLGQEIRHMS